MRDVRLPGAKQTSASNAGRSRFDELQTSGEARLGRYGVEGGPSPRFASEIFVKTSRNAVRTESLV